jgi:hypothetical protein
MAGNLIRQAQLLLINRSNLLINGGFDYAQRQAPASATTIADQKYGPDRWKSYVENASLQYTRKDALGETGLTSQYCGYYQKITNAGKILIAQIVEGRNSVSLRSKTIIFQAKLKTDSARIFRMGILELQNAGTIDSVPAALTAPGSMGADTTDPTFGTNCAVITAAESKSVTTSWATYSISVTVPSNSKNIICAIWSDSDIAANGELWIAEAGLYHSDQEQEWNPRPVGEEIALCQRYYEKSYLLDTAPATVTDTGLFDWISGSNASQNTIVTPTFLVSKRAAPTVTTWRNDTNVSGQWWYNRAGGNGVMNVSVDIISNYGFRVTGNANNPGTYVVVRLYGHWTAESEL